MPVRRANAKWEGTLREGRGTMSFGSGAFEGQYSAQSRFEEGTGTNPEELIGAAHAGCFSMALSLALTEGGHPPDEIATEAQVSISPAEGGGFEIDHIKLTTRGRVPGIDAAGFQEAANAAKEGCPVSKALAGTQIELEASLD